MVSRTGDMVNRVDRAGATVTLGGASFVLRRQGLGFGEGAENPRAMARVVPKAETRVRKNGH